MSFNNTIFLSVVASKIESHQLDLLGNYLLFSMGLSETRYVTYDAQTYKPQTTIVCKNVDLNKHFSTAIASGNLLECQLLLANQSLKPKNSAIILASECGRSDILKLLLQDTRLNPGNNAMGYAAANGHDDCIQILLADNRISPGYDDSFPFRVACANGHYEAVKILLKNEFVKPNDGGNYAIAHAARNGYNKVLKLLLTDSRIDPNSNGDPIIYAVKYNCIESVKLLLNDSRVDPNVSDGKSITLAKKLNHTEILKMLMDHPRVLNKYKFPNSIIESVNMKSFEKIWQDAQLGQFQYNQRLKEICRHTIETYLSVPEITVTSISNEGYWNDNHGETFDINYIIGTDQKKFMQITFYDSVSHLIIPDSIAFN